MKKPSMSKPGISNVQPNFVAGQWRDAGASLPTINPSDTREVVGHYATATALDVHDAFVSARHAFAGWSRSAPLVRSDLLNQVADRLFARRHELGLLLAREEGKSLPEAIGEVLRASQIFRFFSHEAIRLSGETGASTRADVDVTVTRQAVGVVGIITPWNFPIAIPAWKIAPALAFGNCVVFKPAEWAPGCAWELAKLLVDAGLPSGVFNLTMGDGPTTGAALAAHAELDALTFTGSQATGRALALTTVSRGVKLQLEMGGKNPLIVVDDADVSVAVDCAVQSGFFSTGQRCTASSRVIVTRGIHDRFVAALTAATQQLRVGPAVDAATQIGPVVHERQLTKVLDYVGLGQAEGAQLVAGGQRLNLATPGHYLAPALFVDVQPSMRIDSEEIFGPVVGVLRAESYEHALALANNSAFGLSAGIVTTSLATARHFQRHAEAGMVMVNLPTAGVDFHVPFGGTKASSYGSREQGTHAQEFYTRVKTAYVN
jgi:alpha-ketoglutaric semialdehyde dehydrogenase